MKRAHQQADELHRFADVLEEQNAHLPPRKTAKDYSFWLRDPGFECDHICAECGHASHLYEIGCVGEEQTAVCVNCIPVVARRWGLVDATAKEMQECLLAVMRERVRRWALRG